MGLMSMAGVSPFRRRLVRQAFLRLWRMLTVQSPLAGELLSVMGAVGRKSFTRCQHVISVLAIWWARVISVAYTQRQFYAQGSVVL